MRILSEHFRKLRTRLLDYADHIGLAQHGDIKGLAREGVVKEFLKQNLPSVIDYKTGEIIDETDNRSGQIDIVLQSALAPRVYLYEDMQLSFANATLGIIEVKSTLSTGDMTKSNHLKSALDTFAKVKSLKRSQLVSGTVGKVKITHPNTPCFLFAYAGPEKKTLLKKYGEYAKANYLQPDQFAPDVTVVLDKGYYICRGDGWLFPDKSHPYITWNGAPEECIVGMYVYISQIIETWNAQYHPTTFNKYFEQLEKEN